MKKVVSIALVVVMCMSMTMTAFASHETSQDFGEVDSAVQQESVEPKGALCTGCNKGNVSKYVDYGPWKLIKFTACPSGDESHKDAYYERTITTTYKCDSCGLIESESEEIDDKYVCQ